MTADIFDNTIICKNCNIEMEKGYVSKNGFKLRALKCPKCGKSHIHPKDEEEYNKFINLKNKEYRVKMRLVGNSYAISIPKEIVSFMEEHEKATDDIVRLCFSDLGKLTLMFNKGSKTEDREKNDREKR